MTRVRRFFSVFPAYRTVPRAHRWYSQVTDARQSFSGSDSNELSLHSADHSHRSPMTTAAAFSHTLQEITSTKLRELEDQRQAYSAHASTVADKLAKASRVEKVEILLGALTDWHGSGALPNNGTGAIIESKLNLDNLRSWLSQAKADPAFPVAVLDSWIETLQTYVNHSQRRFDCASLFGNLFNEWLASGDSAATGKPLDVDNDGTSSQEDFIAVGRQELQEQKEKLNELIFSAPSIDVVALRAYLAALFEGEDGTKVLDHFRTSVERFGNQLRETKVQPHDIEWIIQSVVSSDLMEETKVATLRQFLGNQTILEELASVLNMRMGFGKWSWPREGLVMDMRRHLNGKYRAFTDPEILDVLLLEYVGIKWQVHLKSLFLYVFNSKIWRRGAGSKLSPREQARRRVFLGHSNTDIHSARRNLQSSHFMATQLASNVHERAAYEPGEDSARTQYSGDGQQKLLHLLVTECNLNRVLHGSHALLRSDFGWFGPSLPHATIIEVLKFFGMSQHWLDFYQIFLRSPVRFKEETAAPLRVRERGTPISYALSVVCGEAVLFVMDLAVNQRTDGLFLYRIHDDLLLWDKDVTKVIKGWDEMKNYADLVGLSYNQNKTGSIVFSSSSVPPGLPEGDIQWGFLKLDKDTGRFIILQNDVEKHIQELRHQLHSAKSLFGWVNVYNKYMAFFVRHFGCPGGRTANCLGTDFVDEAVRTLVKIQRELFGEGASAAGKLLELLGERFGTKDLPRSYAFWPLNLGGLNLRDPIAELIALRQTMKLQSPRQAFQEVKDGDIVRYNSLKASWIEQGRPLPKNSVEAFFPKNHEGHLEFMPFEEYVANPELVLSDWCQKWTEMLNVVQAQPLVATSYIDSLRGSSTPTWGSLGPYDQWILALYGEEVAKHFGKFALVDSELIPLGLLEIYKSSRVKWDQ